MHHLSAFYGALALNTTDTVVPAVVDQAMPTANNRIFPPNQRILLGAFAGGDSLTLAKIDSATLQLNGRPNISPIDSGTVGGSLPGVMWPWDRGFMLPAQEQIGVLETRLGAGTADIFAFLWHTQQIRPVPVGPTRTVRATSAAAGAKGLWFLASLTFDTALARGRYAVVGMNGDGANALAMRLLFQNQVDRPGILATTAVSEYNLAYWRFGAAGYFGTFDNYNPPQIEVMGSGAITTQEVFLDLVQLSG